MLNQYFLVGRLTKDFQLEEKDDKKFAHNTLAVSRSFKNSEGVYETDFFDFTVFGGLAESCFDYCKKGDLVGLKGTLSTYENKIVLKTDKVSFLATKSKKDEIEQEKSIDM